MILGSRVNKASQSFTHHPLDPPENQYAGQAGIFQENGPSGIFWKIQPRMKNSGRWGVKDAEVTGFDQKTKGITSMPIERVNVEGMETVQINLAQLMKLKARYQGLVSKTKALVISHNSELEGTDRPDVRKAFNSHIEAVRRLVFIKQRLDEANQGPQRERIYLLSEMKGLKSWFEDISTTNGITSSGTYQTRTVAEIKIEEQQSTVKELEDGIYSLQDEVDAYNAATRIEIPRAFLTPPAP